MHAISLVQQAAFGGLAGTGGVTQLPEPGNTRVPDFTLAGEQPGTDARGRIVEPIREDGRSVCLAVVVPIDDLPDSLVLDLVRPRIPCPETSCTSPPDRRPCGRPDHRRANPCARAYRSRPRPGGMSRRRRTAPARRCRRRPDWPGAARPRTARPSDQRALETSGWHARPLRRRAQWRDCRAAGRSAGLRHRLARACRKPGTTRAWLARAAMPRGERTSADSSGDPESSIVGQEGGLGQGLSTASSRDIHKK